MEQCLSDQEIGLVQAKIKEKYNQVASSPTGSFRYPVGSEAIRKLEYPPEIIADFPPALLDSFCGVGNPFSLGPARMGEAVLDIGCGAGFDTLVAAKMVGPDGKVRGIDVTAAMLDKAKSNLALLALDNVTFQEGEAELLPFPDQEFDLVISNGVLNLTINKAQAVKEVLRVLKPGGRLQIADMVLMEALPPERAGRMENWYQ
jgi:arsenite methyltransferase